MDHKLLNVKKNLSFTRTWNDSNMQFKVLIRVFDNISNNLKTNVFFLRMLISTHLFSRGPTDEKEKIITHKYRVRDDLCDQGLFSPRG